MSARAAKRKGEREPGGASKPVRAERGASGAPPEREATVHEAKTHLSRLLAEVEAGATVVITRRGRPVARLEAINPKRPRVPGSMKGLISFDESFFDPLPEDELRAWGEL
jgi:antitoxin (DNA-binding transcriptional repressor) of toxin-antitoxin stability system